MKQLLKFLSLMLIAGTVVLASCSKNDDPTDNDFFAGTYKGMVDYNNNQIHSENGSVFVTKIGSATKYNFRFSDNIPDLNGIEFEKQGDAIISVGNNATYYIKITNNQLTMIYKQGDNIWKANCTR
ncbi:hypothetical protein [Niabella aurantiaca]|uniref:hypothetical protein n=1 Tax=Niabella aurantiaca TaxID=379900 RepID=UPI00037C3051|nr:hypothetical protein [Niabella aurantiaca]